MKRDLTLEKLKIDERLGKVENQLGILIEMKKNDHDNLSKSIVQMTEILHKHEKFLYGNGVPGATVRMDRLEQSERMRTWTLRTIAVSTIGLAIKQVFDFWKAR